jgi:hypothetical protein
MVGLLHGRICGCGNRSRLQCPLYVGPTIHGRSVMRLQDVLLSLFNTGANVCTMPR